MNRFYTLFLICFSLPLFAQITITNKHMPSSGDTIRYSVAATLGETGVKQTGADQTWDFTDLTTISQGVDEYKSSIQTPYILNFGFSALGLKLSDSLGFADFKFQNMYNFYRNTTSSFTEIGIGFQFSSFPLPQSGKHSDPDEIYTFPLDYEDVDSTTFSVKVPITLGVVPVGSFFRSGSRVNTVDGWGTISTPYAEDVACIRIKSVITEYDSITVTMASLNFGTTTTRVEYKWLSTTEKIPMLLVSGNEISGTFVPTNIRFRDNYRAIGPAETVKADFETDQTVVGKGEVISINNNSDGNNLSYIWSIEPSSSVLFVNGTSPTSTDPKIVINDTGNFTVQLIAIGTGKKDTAIKTDYLRVLGSSQIFPLNHSEYSAYPNPSNGSILISKPQGTEKLTIKISDLQGRIILNENLGSDNIINTKQINQGTHVVTIFDSNNQIVYRSLHIFSK